MSIRLKDWDYSHNWYYFVTICTGDKKPSFGNIANERMKLSPHGLLAQQCWAEIPFHFPFVVLDEFVIMPDHVHGIVIIDHSNGQGNGNCRDVAVQRPYNGLAETMSAISPKAGSLSVVIRSYKSVVTKMIGIADTHAHFSWQPRFFDRIIRNERELDAVRAYIRNNPLKWKLDRDHPDNIEF
ncbi:hypothetical protein AUK40_01175 [Candidatus Wirthbacteria bacterium CG2_30_54_11]|uniref:Transposase IS200-like domain-containing protein n=1 Tax=Candidatus Wirthbacteria bacterium CG2_30_54_11 TaxID=1817892 RepID=A0A1J5INS9_9BACT|nr:MAG: hypothetical protein AUK40_01175 [Candidatus Wirthbacteria bacterium CG2_30_54_11]